MIIQIEHNSPVPIYEQLVKEITSMIETGQLKENDSLPPIRQLSSQLDVAVNTVARAYQDLERKELIVSNGRKGTFIKNRTTANTPESGFKDQIIALLQMGMDKRDIERLFRNNMNQIFN